MSRKKRDVLEVPNVVFVSDTHCGCQMGLCPAGGVRLDGGGVYRPSRFQRAMWEWWEEAWDEFVPSATKGEPYAIVHVGDALDGVHHGSVTQVSHNIEDQLRIAEECLAPRIAKATSYWHTRGTDAHVGKSAMYEEMLAKRLGAIADADGNHSRWETRLRLGDRLIHVSHHIGTSSSPYSQATAPQKEAVNSFLETGRWGDSPFDLIVRGHRHAWSEVAWAGSKGRIIVCVVPSWQGKTPFVWKLDRLQQPQFGLVVARLVDGELFTRAYVRRIEPPREERV